MAGLPQNYKKDTSKVFRCNEALCDTFSAKRQHCHLTDLLGLRKETLLPWVFFFFFCLGIVTELKHANN